MKNAVLLFLGFLCTCTLNAQTKEIYVSDAGGFNYPPWQILKFDEDGSNGEVFISDHLAWPQDIVFLEAKNEMLISNLNTGVISRFNATTGAYMNEFATGIGGPTRMEIGADGLLYVLQWSGNGRVLRYTTEGTSMGAFTQVGVGTAIGMDWDALGNLYVSSYNGKYVRKYSSTGDDLGKIITTDLAGPTNLWVDFNGDLIVLDYNAGSVKRFGSDGSLKGIVISGLPQCEGVEFLENGHWLIGSGGLHSVRQYTSGGTFVSNFVEPNALGLMTPNAVVLRNKGTSSVGELSTAIESVLVYPSVGTQFSIASDVLSKLAHPMQVHDVSGQTVCTISSASSTWDAGELSAGVYYLIAETSGNAILRQKIVIQK